LICNQIINRYVPTAETLEKCREAGRALAAAALAVE
jgi:hypothetical protein